MVKLTPEDEELNRKLKARFESITQHFPSSAHLEAAFERSRDAILAEVRRVHPSAEIYNVGPDTDRRSDWWACWIKVETDTQRNSLLQNELFMRRLKSAAEAGGFAPCHIEIESQESVDRNYAGNWFNRLR